MSESGLLRLRLPPGLKAKIAAAGKANNRSMNAEIIQRLEHSFPGAGVTRVSLDHSNAAVGVTVEAPGSKAPADLSSSLDAAIRHLLSIRAQVDAQADAPIGVPLLADEDDDFPGEHE